MLMLAALFILKAAAQQVEAVQRTLITKRTASWCPNCGTWGWTLFEGLIADNEDKAVLMAAHYSGNYETQAATDITDNFGGFYQPRFFLNETDINATSSNGSEKRMEVKQAVDEAFSQMPVANVGFAPVFADNTLSVEAKVKFFQDADGEYYLGLYLLESNFTGYQSGIGSDATHHKVLRYSFTDDSFGLPVVNGPVSAGAGFDLSFHLEIGAVEGYDYEVAGIIWKKENDKYIPVNTWSTSDIGTGTATNEVPGVLSFEITPTVATDQATIHIDLLHNLPDATLDIFNVEGRLVAHIGKDVFTRGTHTFPIDRSTTGNNGLYFVRLSDGKNVTTKKVVFQ